MEGIVTIKLEKNSKHDPHNKVLGYCPLYENGKCSDITGKHHSYIEEGKDEQEIWKLARQKYKHITRVEMIR